MCDRRRAGIVAACVLVCMGTGAGAQDVGTERARLARLEAELRVERARRRVRDSLHAATVGVDTVRVGTLTVLSARGVPASLPAATAAAWRVLDARFGHETRVLASVELVVGVPGTPAVVTRVDPMRIRGVGVPADIDSTALAGTLASVAGRVIVDAQDPALRAWLDAHHDPHAPSRARFGDAYVELATGPWTVARRCLAGDLDGCRRMFGLVPGQDFLEQWYDDDERRHLVADAAGPPARWTPQQRACVEHGASAACVAVLRAGGRPLAPPPVTGKLRALLADLALEHGGPGAYDRLMASADRPLAERLAAAAEMSSDSLLREWHARTMAARPESVTLRAAGAWAAFAWVGLLAALGLGSSRWR